MDKEKKVIVVVDSIYNKCPDVFDSITDLEMVISPADEMTLSETIRSNNAFGVVPGVDRYTGTLYQSLEKGGIIARFGVGYDGIDLNKAKQYGLYVTNTPEVLESTVAEFTIFLAAEVLRSIGLTNERMKRGEWQPIMGNELNGKTWAIMGPGKIGRRVCQILAFGFGIDVLAFKKSEIDHELAMKWGISKSSSDFSEIIPFADIVSVHMPANQENHHFLNRARLDQFKRGAVLINTARGSLVDEEALYDVLETGRLSGAGLDVFENEPYRPANPDKDLRRLPNVILTPHVASSTRECSKRIAERVIQNIRYAIDRNSGKMDIVPPLS